MLSAPKCLLDTFKPISKFRYYLATSRTVIMLLPVHKIDCAFDLDPTWSLIAIVEALKVLSEYVSKGYNVIGKSCNVGKTLEHAIGAFSYFYVGPHVLPFLGWSTFLHHFLTLPSSSPISSRSQPSSFRRPCKSPAHATTPSPASSSHARSLR